MFNQITRFSRGFTIIEIVVVLLLVSIVAATVFGRSISTDQMNFRSQFDKIRNQMRYPQSMAMKSHVWWGLTNDENHYWIFTQTDETASAIPRPLPGQEDIQIALADLGITMTPAFTIIFDPYGIPYWGDANTKMNSEQTITLKVPGSYTATFTIIPETGFIR